MSTCLQISKSSLIWGIFWAKVQDFKEILIFGSFQEFSDTKDNYAKFCSNYRIWYCIIYEKIGMVFLHKNQALLASTDVIHNNHAQSGDLYPLIFSWNFHENGVFDIHWNFYWITFLGGPAWSKQLPFWKSLLSWLRLTFNLNENSY